METIRQYQTFETVEKMNKHIDKLFKNFEFNDTEREILFTISKHSVKVLGVCWLKNKTLANIVGKSIGTVKNAIRKFKNMGIIKRVRQNRKKSGGDGASLTIIFPKLTTAVDHREEKKNDEKPCQTYNLEPTEKSETIISKTPIYKIINYIHSKIKNNSFSNIENQPEKYATAKGVPIEIINELKHGLNTSEIIKIWTCIKRTLGKYQASYTLYKDHVINSIRQTITIYKRKNLKNFNFAGCICGLMKKEIKAHLERKYEEFLKEDRKPILFSTSYLYKLTKNEQTTAFLLGIRPKNKAKEGLPF